MNAALSVRLTTHTYKRHAYLVRWHRTCRGPAAPQSTEVRMKALVSLRSGLLALASVSLLVACAPESPTVGSEEQSTRKNPIIGGTPATGYPESVLINMSQNGQIV